MPVHMPPHVHPSASQAVSLAAEVQLAGVPWQGGALGLAAPSPASWETVCIPSDALDASELAPLLPP